VVEQEKGKLLEVLASTVEGSGKKKEVVEHTPKESKIAVPVAAMETAEKKAEAVPTPKESKILDLKRKLLNFRAKAQDQKVRGIKYKLGLNKFVGVEFHLG
jgi:hypothetical protein